MISKEDLPTDEDIFKLAKHLFLIINAYCMAANDIPSLKSGYDDVNPELRLNLEKTIKDAIMDCADAS